MLTIRPTAPDAGSSLHAAESRHAHDAGSRRQPRLAAALLQKEKLTQPPPPPPSKSSKKVLAENTKRGVDRSVECTGNINAMIQGVECVMMKFRAARPHPKKRKRHVATFTHLLHTHYARKCRPLGGSFGAIEAHTIVDILTDWFLVAHVCCAPMRWVDIVRWLHSLFLDPLLRPQVTYNDLQAICANNRLVCVLFTRPFSQQRQCCWLVSLPPSSGWMCAHLRCLRPENITNMDSSRQEDVNLLIKRLPFADISKPRE
ncbi:hypothetical protein U9M48_029630 [Paspalum notatum var. saurae]|uniref:Uncharacterized protein n=1 Tax=Paspalum notatum var. saurae TaxID=547442 RepID=A0AAQ3X1C4_PASNO